MPALRGHMIFMTHLAEALREELPAASAAVEANWPSALLGSEAPDSWYLIAGAKRPDMHMLDADDPQTWPGALERWLDAHAHLSPGRDQPPETAAFVVGYLSHIGLDTWAEQYQHASLPAAARYAAQSEWFPAAVSQRGRLQAALRALAEAPCPPERIVGPADLERSPVPGGFPADEIRRVACGIAPGLPVNDPWAISRINPLRQVPSSSDERRRWEQHRATQTPATPMELAATIRGATAFTIHHIQRWW